MKKPRCPRFGRVQPPPRMVLTDRDRKILHAVHRYRLLLREQVEQLLFQPENGQDHFTKTSRVRLRLKLLYQNRYLERVPLPGAPGTWVWQPVYRLAAKGAQLVAEELGVKVSDLLYWGKGDDKDHRLTRVTPLFLNHALEINAVRISVILAAEQNGYRVEKWLDDGQLKRRELKDYVSVREQGGSRSVPILPDAYFVLNLGDRRAHFFLEHDRATMSNARWATRVTAYLTYVRSGKYRERYQTRSLRILTVTTSEQRMINLKETTQKAGGEDMFWFTTFDQVTPASVLFGPIWLLANDERDSARKVLIE